MTYTRLLNKLIEESGLSNKEILEKCEAYGMKITPNYLSVLKNNETKVASDELSRVFAKICGAPSEEVLVVQAYLDKAPSIIIECLNLIFETGKKAMERQMELNKDIFPEEIYLAIVEETKRTFENTSLAELICQYPQMVQETGVSEIFTSDKGVGVTRNNKKWVVIPIESEEDIKVIGL